jgi:hypothetical protein
MEPTRWVRSDLSGRDAAAPAIHKILPLTRGADIGAVLARGCELCTACGHNPWTLSSTLPTHCEQAVSPFKGCAK